MKQRRNCETAKYMIYGYNICLQGQDFNLRPSGYEPDELPGCSVQGMMQSQRCCV
jgi:hypothetical protein